MSESSSSSRVKTVVGCGLLAVGVAAPLAQHVLAPTSGQLLAGLIEKQNSVV